VAGGAGLSEGEFFDAQGQQKSTGLGLSGFGGKILRAHVTEDRGKRFARETDLVASASGMQLRQEIGDSRLDWSGDRFRSAHAEEKRVRRAPLPILLIP